MKDDDLVGSDGWDSEWQTRDKSFHIKIYDALRQWALRDRLRMVKMFCDQATTRKDRLSVIELGCAPGTMLQEVYRACPESDLHGLDYSEEGLKIANRHLGELGISAELACGDIRVFQPKTKYDLVLSFGLIEHFSNPEEILQAHMNFTVSNGMVAVSVPNFKAPIVQWALRKFRPETLETHNLDVMNEKVLYDLFQRCGFVDIEVGGAIGPLLPTPDSAPDLPSKIYSVLASIWNVCIRILPPKWTWYGSYWAYGRAPERQPD